MEAVRSRRHGLVLLLTFAMDDNRKDSTGFESHVWFRLCICVPIFDFLATTASACIYGGEENLPER
jgi:hypothetical protein